MRSIGLDLQPALDHGLLKTVAARPTFYSLEMHLAMMLREVQTFEPSLVVLDPISAFLDSGDQLEVQSMLLRMIDYLKSHGITGVFTHLAHMQGEARTDAGLSSLMDAWILLLNREVNGEFNRELYLLKARGTAHSNQVREFVMGDTGIRLVTPYLGEDGALTGSARRFAEARDRRLEAGRRAEIDRLQDKIAERRRRVQSQIDALQADLQADEVELRRVIEGEAAYRDQAAMDALDIAAARGLNNAGRE